MSNLDRRAFLKGVGATGLGVSLAGCSGVIDGGGSDSLEKVGMTAYVRGGSWITAYNEAANFYAEDQGIELEVRPNQQRAQKQASDIRDFNNGDHDAILVGVWSTGAAESAINQAIDQGTPVFSTRTRPTSWRSPN